MADSQPPLEHSRLRSRGGCLFLGLPMLLVPIVLGAYAWIWGQGLRGRPPTGEVVRMHYAGCPEAEAVVLARVERMGLGGPRSEAVDGGFAIVARMPEDKRVAAQIPLTLAEPGAFELLWGDGEERVAGPGDVREVYPRMTGDASANTVVALVPEVAGPLQRRQLDDPEGHLSVRIDGVVVATVPNTSPLTEHEVEIEPEPEETRAAIERAAARAIVLADPLPCAVELVDAAPAAP